MDEKQLKMEFMSILSESHPGLTFEEYRDACVYLLFYQYCCLRFADRLEDTVLLRELVRMAVRGKLQIPSFLRFMENASGYMRICDSQLSFFEYTFVDRLKESISQEKQKSYARFIRKLIKKIDAWDCDELLLEMYPDLFSELVKAFAGSKKETSISDQLCSLYRYLFDMSGAACESMLVPEFGYGLLYNVMEEEGSEPAFYGNETHREYMEIFHMICYMKGRDPGKVNVSMDYVWNEQGALSGRIDRIAIYMPEGVEGGKLLVEPDSLPWDKDLLNSRAKGELPFLLSSLPYLNRTGCLTAVLPGAMLYREGKEAQIRKYLIDELDCLEAVILLPDSVFSSLGQKEIMLFFRMNRDSDKIMLFDASEASGFDEDTLDRIGTAIREGKNEAGFCAAVSREDIRKNNYNLNLPRYISKTVREISLDVEARRERIRQIDRELKEIDEMIAMYRRALEIQG